MEQSEIIRIARQISARILRDRLDDAYQTARLGYNLNYRDAREVHAQINTIAQQLEPPKQQSTAKFFGLDK